MPAAPGLGGIGAVPAVPNLSGMTLPTVNPAAGLSQMFMGNQLQNTFGLVGQMQQMQLQQAQQDSAMKRLQSLAAVASSGNAGIAQDPKFKQSVSQAWVQAGLGQTPPLDSNGNLDLTAIGNLADPNIAYKKALAGYDTVRAENYPALVGSQITKNAASAQYFQIRSQLAPGQAVAYENLADARTVLANMQASLLPGETAAKEKLQGAQAAIDGMLLKYKPGMMLSQTDANEARAALDNVEASYLPLLDTAKANQLNASAKEAQQHGTLYVQQAQESHQRVLGLIRMGGLTPSGYYSALRGLDENIRAGQGQIDAIQSKLAPNYQDPTTHQPLSDDEKAGLVTSLQHVKAQVQSDLQLKQQLDDKTATMAQPLHGTAPMSPQEMMKKYPDVHSLNDLEKYDDPVAEKEGKITYIDKASGDILVWDRRAGKFYIAAQGTSNQQFGIGQVNPNL